jgi:hypothetical protein
VSCDDYYDCAFFEVTSRRFYAVITARSADEARRMATEELEVSSLGYDPSDALLIRQLPHPDDRPGFLVARYDGGQ